MIEIMTQRLRLRDHVPEDLATHHELMSDPVAMRFLSGHLTHTLDESQQNLALAIDACQKPERTHYFLRVEDRVTAEHIGEVGYTVSKFLPIGKTAGIGYFYRQTHWGRGYATEALRALIRFAFLADNVYRLSSGCLVENKASERVLQKAGMIREAYFKEYQWHEGQLKDRVEYRLLKHEYRE